MKILALSDRLQTYLEQHRLERRFQKQVGLFVVNPRHPSLHTELLEPKHLGLYSFRLNKKYRVLFVYCGNDTVEVIDINNHYAS